MFQHSLFYENESENEMEGGELSSVTTCGGEYFTDESENEMEGGDNSEYETDNEIMIGGDDETSNDGDNYKGGGIKKYTQLLRTIITKSNTEKNIKNQIIQQLYDNYKVMNKQEELIKHLLIFYKHFAGIDKKSYTKDDIQNIFVNPNKVNEIITSLNDYVNNTTQGKKEVDHEKIKEILFGEKNDE